MLPALKTKQFGISLTIVAFAVLMVAFILFPSAAQAQLPDQIVPDCGEDGICGFCELIVLASNIVDFLVYFAIFVAVLLFVWGGFIMLTSAGRDEKISQSKSIFVNVFIGLLIVLAAWLIIDLIMQGLVSDEIQTFGPWNNLGSDFCGTG